MLGLLGRKGRPGLLYRSHLILQGGIHEQR
jgi:hypothetical protein